jgi:hypothetical protein
MIVVGYLAIHAGLESHTGAKLAIWKLAGYADVSPGRLDEENFGSDWLEVRSKVNSALESQDILLEWLDADSAKQRLVETLKPSARYDNPDIASLVNNGELRHGPERHRLATEHHPCSNYPSV